MSAEQKLARARAHLDELRAGVERFRAATANDLVERLVGPSGIVEYRMRRLPPPAGEIALAFGDFLQNTRAALDHVVYDLSTETRPDFDRTGFPVVVSEESYEEEVRRLLPFVREDARAVIRQFQPFAFGVGEHDLFLTLHRLAIVDRHRAVTLLANVVEVQHVSWSREDPNDSDPQIVMYRDAVSPGDLILQLPSAESEPSATFDPAFRGTIVVGEGDRFSSRPEVVQLAEAMFNRVAAAVLALQRLLVN